MKRTITWPSSDLFDGVVSFFLGGSPLPFPSPPLGFVWRRFWLVVMFFPPCRSLASPAQPRASTPLSLYQRQNHFLRTPDQRHRLLPDICVPHPRPCYLNSLPHPPAERVYRRVGPIPHTCCQHKYLLSLGVGGYLYGNFSPRASPVCYLYQVSEMRFFFASWSAQLIGIFHSPMFFFFSASKMNPALDSICLGVSASREPSFTNPLPSSIALHASISLSPLG